MNNVTKYKTIVIMGAQWGDEGKGKISDYLAQNADIVVRYQGGNNAGHSIEFDNKRFALKHIPSGIFNPKTVNILAQGMVINPKMLIDEIKELESKGVTNYQLYISDRAHVIFPFHLDIDEAIENIKFKIDPKKMIGTTKKGIGPAYEDKVARIGMRFCDFINETSFKDVLQDQLLIKNKVLKAFDLKQYTVEEIFKEYWEYVKALKPLVRETSVFLADAIEKGQTIIFEGAQGVMLCLENGTYPFVTSSSPIASAVPLGTGINHTHLNEVLGVVKAYSTRVGEGAMPTILEEINPSLANFIREKGREFGTVTGKPRKIGWLDAVILKHTKRVTGMNKIALTLLDVLDDLDEIKVAYAYELNGKEINYVPSSNLDYSKCKPLYKKFKGWKQNITNVTSFKKLPKNAQIYIKAIEEIVQVPITLFSVGPNRKQTIKI